MWLSPPGGHCPEALPASAADHLPEGPAGLEPCGAAQGCRGSGSAGFHPHQSGPTLHWAALCHPQRWGLRSQVSRVILTSSIRGHYKNTSLSLVTLNEIIFRWCSSWYHRSPSINQSNSIHIAHFEQIKMLQKICNKITITIKQIGRDCSFNEVEIKTHWWRSFLLMYRKLLLN